MNIDQVLRFLAPLAPAVLPIIVYVWHRTRRELREIRLELGELRQATMVLDPRLDELRDTIEVMSAEISRLAEVQGSALRLMSGQPAGLKPDSRVGPG